MSAIRFPDNFDRLIRWLYREARSICSDTRIIDQAVDDAVQALLERVQTEEVHSWSGWLLRAVQNRVSVLAKHAKTETSGELDSFACPAATEGSHRLHDLREILHSLVRAIPMTDRQRAVMRAALAGALTAEIAAERGISPRSVRKAINEASRRLHAEWLRRIRSTEHEDDRESFQNRAPADL